MIYVAECEIFNISWSYWYSTFLHFYIFKFHSTLIVTYVLSSSIILYNQIQFSEVEVHHQKDDLFVQHSRI